MLGSTYALLVVLMMAGFILAAIMICNNMSGRCLTWNINSDLILTGIGILIFIIGLTMFIKCSRTTTPEEESSASEIVEETIDTADYNQNIHYYVLRKYYGYLGNHYELYEISPEELFISEATETAVHEYGQDAYYVIRTRGFFGNRYDLYEISAEEASLLEDVNFYTDCRDQDIYLVVHKRWGFGGYKWDGFTGIDLYSNNK